MKDNQYLMALFGAAGVAVFFALMTIASDTSYSSGQKDIANDCSALGAFVVKGVKYECKSI